MALYITFDVTKDAVPGAIQYEFAGILLDAAGSRIHIMLDSLDGIHRHTVHVTGSQADSLMSTINTSDFSPPADSFKKRILIWLEANIADYSGTITDD
ncbi:MAG: hypothetical protein GWN76_14660 [candidate division Zixibacteria bacterium]|nr:hypothetical protein [candidate division Zixibacteria bacterium]NIR65382.1 hypothetical protein [candidate division Zixibacteria bacterium]NIS47076.1 hypothetical protein [candidate division Zixibacteria bacterium]NIU15212.1 hypothetical protein [candidate division Zixibacteria bacterium]